jgi:3-oxoacyl-[acyl-carrier-protein] synthase II
MRLAVKKANLPLTAVDYINAHGSGTILNDRHETAGIKAALGDHAYRLPVSSTKSALGHLMGAAGAVEAIVCVKALETQTVPPTLNYREPDPDCDLDYVPGQARSLPLAVALTNSIGFGGHNAALVFGREINNGKH